jgi:hypothetical protein
MMLTMLMWLTVCLPFVNESQEKTKAQTEQSSNETESEEDNPLSNTNEEKGENSTSLLSEYLHDLEVLEHHFTIFSALFKCHPTGTYIAYHPKLIIPPPEA